MVFLFSFLGAFFRRWFGGGFGRFGELSRFFKYLVLASIVLFMFWSKGILDFQNWRIYGTIVSFSIHWAIGHGDYFYLLDTRKDEARIKWIDYLLRKIYGEGKYYNFKGNCSGMFLRYTSSAVLVSFFVLNGCFCFSGLLTLLSYVVTCKMRTPIVLAEFISGFVNFGMLYLCLR